MGREECARAPHNTRRTRACGRTRMRAPRLRVFEAVPRVVGSVGGEKGIGEGGGGLHRKAAYYKMRN